DRRPCNPRLRAGNLDRVSRTGGHAFRDAGPARRRAADPEDRAPSARQSGASPLRTDAREQALLHRGSVPPGRPLRPTDHHNRGSDFLRRHLARAILASPLLGCTAPYPVDPLEPAAPAYTPSVQDDGRLLVTTFSGGGTRAATFAQGAL